MSWSLFPRAPADTAAATSMVPMATVRRRRILHQNAMEGAWRAVNARPTNAGCLLPADLPRCRRGSSLRAQQQLLHAPVGGFGDVDFVLGRARQLVGAGELSEQAAGAADDSEDLAVERDLEDPAGERGLADEHHLIGAGRDADRIRGANQRSQPLAGWRVPVDRPGPGSGRHIDGEHPHKPALGIEDLNAPVRSIADVDVVVAID